MQRPPASDEKKKNPPIRIWLRWLLFPLFAFILLLPLLWAGLQTRWVKTQLAALIKSATADAGMFRVTLKGLDGRLPFSMTVDRLVLSDEEGAWLEVRNLDVSVTPASLLAGVVDIERCRMGALTVLRRPRQAKAWGGKNGAPGPTGRCPLFSPFAAA